MKKFAIVVFLSILSNACFSQSQCSYLKVDNVLRVYSEVKFKPINKLRGYDKEFKKILLSMNENGDTWQQACINSWYVCEKKSDNFYQIWLMDYPKITKDYWQKNCYELSFLMMFDTPALAEFK